MGPDIAEWMRSLRVPNRPDEYEVKKLLKQSGVSVPDGRIVEIGEEPELNGLTSPYAAKVCSSEILHKSDHGGIILNVDEGKILEAVRSIQSRFPEARVLVERMCHYSGPEFIIGSLVDPVLGLTIMTGAGGILTEIYRDVSFRLAPCNVETASEMLDELTVAPVLNGYRGIRLDRNGLASVISRVSHLVSEIGDRFSQMDINPIVYAHDEWIVLDAKLILVESETIP